MPALLALLAAACSPGLGTIAGAAGVPGFEAQPVGLYLTWLRDPSTTMIIDWHTPRPMRHPVLEYRLAGERDWQTQTPRDLAFPYTGRPIYRAELTGLQPDRSYEFRFGEGWRTYSFRTMPRTLSRPVRFVVGGDTRHRKDWMEQTGVQATSYDPDFIVLGGDLAYANGRPENFALWYEWFEAVRNSLITPEGRAIPILLAIGNHEVDGGYYNRVQGYSQTDGVREWIAPFFYGLFASPGQPGYTAIDFGDYLSILLLDTDHSNPIDGAQTEWLEQALAQRRHVPHVFPVYHVPAYPSVRRFDGEVSERVRELWVPLFERHDVQVAFENHDHVYKRTFPLRAGERNPGGIVYIGDGAWGVAVREIGRDQNGELAWYLERAESLRHLILGEIEQDQRRFIMVDSDGNVFDEFPAGSRAAIGPPRFATPAPAAAGSP